MSWPLAGLLLTDPGADLSGDLSATVRRPIEGPRDQPPDRCTVLPCGPTRDNITHPPAQRRIPYCNRSGARAWLLTCGHVSPTRAPRESGRACATCLHSDG